MNKALSIFNQLRPITIGYDSVFDHFEKMFDDDWSVPTYPPYNICKTGDYTYNIEIALAGYNKKNIAVDYADGILTIKSIKDEKGRTRSFTRGSPRGISPSPLRLRRMLRSREPN